MPLAVTAARVGLPPVSPADGQPESRYHGSQCQGPPQGLESVPISAASTLCPHVRAQSVRLFGNDRAQHWSVAPVPLTT